MDIEEFYDEDERRRASPELELGTEWRDRHGVRYELNWVEDTGELYVMREPVPKEWADPFGGIHVPVDDSVSIAGMTVVVVGQIATRDQLDSVLSGWQKAMNRPEGVEWLAERLRAGGVAVTTPAEPSGDGEPTEGEPSEG